MGRGQFLSVRDSEKMTKKRKERKPVVVKKKRRCQGALIALRQHIDSTDEATRDFQAAVEKGDEHEIDLTAENLEDHLRDMVNLRKDVTRSCSLRKR